MEHNNSLHDSVYQNSYSLTMLAKTRRLGTYISKSVFVSMNKP